MCIIFRVAFPQKFLPGCRNDKNGRKQTGQCGGAFTGLAVFSHHAGCFSPLGTLIASPAQHFFANHSLYRQDILLYTFGTPVADFRTVS
jgi:hypothetical protein